VQNTIGYVTTDRTSTSEEINTSLDLDSGVELIFRTDYVPLDRLATGADAKRIRVNTINPQAEADRIAREREARTTAQTGERKARTERLDSALRPPPPPSPSGSGSAGTPRGPSGGAPGGAGAGPSGGAGAGPSGGPPGGAGGSGTTGGTAGTSGARTGSGGGATGTGGGSSGSSGSSSGGSDSTRFGK
jgi:hypothetical protein